MKKILVGIAMFIALVAAAQIMLTGCSWFEDDDNDASTAPGSDCQAFPDIQIDLEDPCTIWIMDFKSTCDILIAYVHVDNYQHASWSGNPVSMQLDKFNQVHYLTADIYFENGDHAVFDDWPGFESPGCWERTGGGTGDEIIVQCYPDPAKNCDDEIAKWNVIDGAGFYQLYQNGLEEGEPVPAAYADFEGIISYGYEQLTANATIRVVADTGDSGQTTHDRECPGD